MYIVVGIQGSFPFCFELYNRINILLILRVLWEKGEFRALFFRFGEGFIKSSFIFVELFNQDLLISSVLFLSLFQIFFQLPWPEVQLLGFDYDLLLENDVLPHEEHDFVKAVCSLSIEGNFIHIQIVLKPIHCFCLRRISDRSSQLNNHLIVFFIQLLHVIQNLPLNAIHQKCFALFQFSSDQQMNSLAVNIEQGEVEILWDAGQQLQVLVMESEEPGVVLKVDLLLFGVLLDPVHDVPAEDGLELIECVEGLFALFEVPFDVRNGYLQVVFEECLFYVGDSESFW